MVAYREMKAERGYGEEGRQNEERSRDRTNMWKERETGRVGSGGYTGRYLQHGCTAQSDGIPRVIE